MKILRQIIENTQPKKMKIEIMSTDTIKKASSPFCHDSNVDKKIENIHQINIKFNGNNNRVAWPTISTPKQQDLDDVINTSQDNQS